MAQEVINKVTLTNQQKGQSSLANLRKQVFYPNVLEWSYSNALVVLFARWWEVGALLQFTKTP